MKTVTYEEFLDFGPCWLEGEDKGWWIKASFDRFGGRMSALDILNLDDVSEEDRLWAVLREEFIPAPILHEFACVCAEYALTLIDNPDPRSVKAVEVKRAWMGGEVRDRELDAARAAAWDAWGVAKAAAGEAAKAAWEAASDAAEDAAWYASRAAWHTAWAAWRTDVGAAAASTYEAQVAYLIMALED